MTGYSVTYIREFADNYEKGKKNHKICAVNGPDEKEGWVRDQSALGIQQGDIIEFVAIRTDEVYKGKIQWKISDVKLLKKGDEVEFTFGAAPKYIPGQSYPIAPAPAAPVVMPPPASFNNTVQMNAPEFRRIYAINPNEDKDASMFRMALERDTWMQRMIAALDRNTEMLQKLQQELLRHDNV